MESSKVLVNSLPLATSSSLLLITSVASSPISASQDEFVSSLGSSTPAISPISSSDLPIINYPAPLPKFSPAIETALLSGNKGQIFTVYNDIIKQAKNFYDSLLPKDNYKAKLSYASIGKTMIKKYPVLSVSDGRPGSVSWNHFTTKLSSFMRNYRCRIKHKLQSASTSTSAANDKVRKTTSQCRISPLPCLPDLSEEDYERHIGEIKKKIRSKISSEHHLKELLFQTHNKRREWINTWSSNDLTLLQVLEKFPCFYNSNLLINEL